MLTNLQLPPLCFRWFSVNTIFLAVLLCPLSSGAIAQTTIAKLEVTEEKTPRTNLFGTQVAPDKALPLLKQAANPEPAMDILQRTGTAHNNQKAAITDSVAEGTVTIYTAGGPVVFGVTLIQNGEHGSQRILLKQPDGKMWDGRGEHLAHGGRQALEFLQTQHGRGFRQLLNSPNRNATIVDNGIVSASRVVTVLEENGDSTKYILDPATSRMARFEFIRGQSRDSVGNVSPIVHSYSSADFRDADGVATPFHIDHSINGVKQEELQLTKVRYSAPSISAPVIRSIGR